MRKFIRRFLLFLLPMVVLVSMIFALDVFQIFGFQDYYADQSVGVNRSMITTTTYNHYRGQERYDSFVFGSSRSQAFKCKSWVPYLEDSAVPFHFDGSGEGIWDIAQKVTYIDELGDTIRHALVILDRVAIETIAPRSGHLFVAMPCISKGSNFAYYSVFLKASLEPKFLLAYLDYSLFGKRRAYMDGVMTQNEYPHTTNDTTCDLWYGVDRVIAGDSLAYYQQKQKEGVFYERKGPRRGVIPIAEEEVALLNQIKNIFAKHKTEYKIVLAPIYNQIPLDGDQLQLLQEIFGPEHVFDFSGKNEFTEPIHNYYETSHFRPHVADEILKRIYTQD